MVTKSRNTHLQALHQKRFLILMVLILVTIVLAPFLDVFVQTRIMMDILLTAIFFTIIFAIKTRHTHVIIASILVLPLITSTWSSYFYDSTHLSLLTRIFGALFFGYAVVLILLEIARSTEVSKETIFAAVVAYLLIALMWSFLYMILELAEPGSFSVPSQSNRLETMHFEYFSFVTITTLGYGDVTPLTNRASALALLEALIGQIYMVVLVAWLVGMYVSRRSK